MRLLKLLPIVLIFLITTPLLGFTVNLNWNHLNEGNQYKIFVRGEAEDYNFDNPIWQFELIEENSVNIETVNFTSTLTKPDGDYSGNIKMFFRVKCYKEINGFFVEVNTSNETSVICDADSVYDLELLFSPYSFKIDM